MDLGSALHVQDFCRRASLDARFIPEILLVCSLILFNLGMKYLYLLFLHVLIDLQVCMPKCIIPRVTAKYRRIGAYQIYVNTKLE